MSVFHRVHSVCENRSSNYCGTAAAKRFGIDHRNFNIQPRSANTGVVRMLSTGIPDPLARSRRRWQDNIHGRLCASVLRSCSHRRCATGTTTHAGMSVFAVDMSLCTLSVSPSPDVLISQAERPSPRLLNWFQITGPNVFRWPSPWSLRPLISS
ncbi:hypothetical protein BC628DRAFT_247021 [Trametes gibbosa]|nr:hypothetical protein BC628DRAFT_247021 [Trametes gibbosa]